MKPNYDAWIELADYFKNPSSQRQKQYEAVRAVVIENNTIDKVAKKYGYKPSTIYSLLRDAKAGRISLFPTVTKGLKKRKTHSDIQDRVIALRKQALSTPDIYQQLLKEDIKSSISTVQRILKEAGFTKLPRRTNQELGN